MFWSDKEANSITLIDQSAFRDCSNLCYFEMPTAVTEIRQYAFNSCTNFMTGNNIGDLEIDEFFNNIQYIGNFVFGNCTNGFANATIRFGSPLISIGRASFL